MNRLKLTALAVTGIMTAHLQAQKTPNVVVILLDDMGYGDLSMTGATGYSTPNIDRLCVEGMRFTHYYSPQAVSSASRAGLLTGCYPNRIGFAGALGSSADIGIADSEETIADVLRKKGYACSAVGKWHLGHHPQFLPVRHGFDEYYGLPYSNDMKPLVLIEGDQVINAEPKPEDMMQLTTRYTERAVRFIEGNKNRPFFLYLAHTMPHVPLRVSEKFKGKSEQGMYGDVMMEIDWSVGEILKTLEKSGIDKNTLVIFTSDNGPWINFGNHAGSTGGLREAKGATYEGGQRVPCIMRWPGKIPAGVICNRLASSIDLLPTIAHFCDAPLPPLKIDGINIARLMLGDETSRPREYFLYYYRKNNLEAVRNDRFKLVLPHLGRSYAGFLPGQDGQSGQVNERHQENLALYDLRRDPGERYDVQNQHPEVIAELMKVVEAARLDLGDDLTGRDGTGRRAIGKL
ncbi:MAG: sulfatase [Bacteroidales bacterium]|nr:sulfatase [Bacteroidales bacterium]